jgi:hypothetical protein
VRNQWWNEKLKDKALIASALFNAYNNIEKITQR